MKSSSLGVACNLALLCAVAANGGAQSAVGFRGGPDHSGVYAGGGAAIAGLQWRFLTGGDVVSSPTVASNVVYVGSGDGNLYALDRLGGTKLWSFDAGVPIASSPVVAEGLVVFGGYDGRYFAVDSRTGKERWRLSTGPVVPFPWGHESGDRYTSSPVVVNGVAYFGAGDGDVYAVRLANGRVVWRSKTGGRVRGSPAVANGLVVVGSFDGRVYAFDAKSGATRWRYDTEGVTLQSGNYGFDRRSVQSSPAMANGVVYVGARDGFVYALGLDDGKLRWRYDHKISWINSSPAVADGVVYDGSSDAQFVQALDAATGRELWRTNVGSTAWSSPAVAGDQVYIGDGAGRLHVLDRRTGRDLATFRTASGMFSSPAIAGDLAIVGSNDGGVYAIRLTNGPATQRAVLLDSAYVRADMAGRSPDVAAYLRNRGYAVVGPSALADFLRARIDDRQPSVVVFATDHVPATVDDGSARSSLFRRYLEAGGKIVWTGIAPGLWSLDSAGKFGGLAVFQWNAPTRLLDVDHRATIFDDRGAHSTIEGLRWGFPKSWRAAYGIDPRGVTKVLAVDEWGLAAGWVKSYGGPPGTGFVRVPGDDLLAIYLAAEYRPGP